jgi:hypothetical protein
MFPKFEGKKQNCCNFSLGQNVIKINRLSRGIELNFKPTLGTYCSSVNSTTHSKAASARVKTFPAHTKSHFALFVFRWGNRLAQQKAEAEHAKL